LRKIQGRVVYLLDKKISVEEKVVLCMGNEWSALFSKAGFENLEFEK
jgi:hypothetical protein